MPQINQSNIGNWTLSAGYNDRGFALIGEVSNRCDVNMRPTDSVIQNKVIYCFQFLSTRIRLGEVTVPSDTGYIVLKTHLGPQA